jgi:glycosyltransferase involved in cell wall biosynthesis
LAPVPAPLTTLVLVLPLHRWHPSTESLLKSGFAELSRCISGRASLVPILSLDGPVESGPESIERLRSEGWGVVHSAVQQGKGAAVRRGLEARDADYYAFTDSDYPFRPESFQAVVEELLRGADLVFGKRSAAYRRNLPKSRKRISTVLEFFNRHALGLKHPDTQCGLKGFSQKGRDLALQTQSKGFLLDLELALLAGRAPDLNWTAVYVETREGLEFSKMNSSTLGRELLELMKLLGRHSFRSRS